MLLTLFFGLDKHVLIPAVEDEKKGSSLGNSWRRMKVYVRWTVAAQDLDDESLNGQNNHIQNAQQLRWSGGIKDAILLILSGEHPALFVTVY